MLGKGWVGEVRSPCIVDCGTGFSSISHLRDLPVRAPTLDPAFTAAQLGARFPAEVFNTATERSKLLTYLWQADLLFFGGGSIIKELYASTGRHPYSTLLMVLATVTLPSSGPGSSCENQGDTERVPAMMPSG